MKALISLFILSVLSGCTTWYKTGATKQDYDVDSAGCVSSAYNAAPPVITPSQVGSGYQQPSYTNCTGGYGSVNCVTTGGQYIPPATIYVDQNAPAQKASFTSCMYRNGWTTQNAGPPRQSPSTTGSMDVCDKWGNPKDRYGNPCRQ